MSRGRTVLASVAAVVLSASGVGVGYLAMPEKVRIVVTTEATTETQEVHEVVTVADANTDVCDGYPAGRQGMRLCVQAVNLDRQFKIFRKACDDPLIAESLGLSEADLALC